MGEQNEVAKKEQASSGGGQGGLRGSLCGDWRVTGVSMEWSAMTGPLENVGYAAGVALMEPEEGCSCCPGGGRLCNRTRQLDTEPKWRIRGDGRRHQAEKGGHVRSADWLTSRETSLL